VSSEQTTETLRVPVVPITATDNFVSSDVGDVRFHALVLERGLPHTLATGWPTDAQSVDPLLPYAIATARWRFGGGALLDLGRLFGDPCVALIEIRRGWLDLDAAAAEHAVLADVEAWVLEALPRATPGEHTINVRFSSKDARASASRRLAVPAWTELADNYPAAVRVELERLMATRPAFAGSGRLLLWHGEPGTGKTHAVRALGWEWHDWCDLHYVTDPEAFFGGGSAYMMRVLLDEDDDEDEGAGERWRLLVLEDTGELLSADAKERTGQGLSRLLNLVDGLIGQGLRVLVLVTTNEPIRRLHSAVARPGRTLAALDFTAFAEAEAASWLARRGSSAEPRQATLAELYALAAGRPVEIKRRVGF
jgi:ATPase family associated with various cellular activities (AAA)